MSPPGSSGPPDLDAWRRAARIAAEARELGARLAVPGRSLYDLAQEIEGFIRKNGAEPAFPANLSRNDEAAHFTPPPDDGISLASGDLLKVDVGAHIGGAIADTATTVAVGGGRKNESLVKAAHEAVEAGIARVHGGSSVNEIATAIESTIGRRGFKPIRDLTGHTIEPYLLHAGKSVPNVAGLSAARLDAGEVVAIEPFATNGAGGIENGPFGNILRFRRAPVGVDRDVAALFDRFRTLPFTLRWVDDLDLRRRVLAARRQLQSYPVFLERGHGLVAQAEHTVLVTPDGVEVLTRLGDDR
ncbi:MAG TPA: type II methionyl aminopeptidase [Thermoplasmata archaeon]|nr:type II methionyl aminopeptidase [Thermoplasmata archaeon]